MTQPPKILMCPECGMRITVRQTGEALCACVALDESVGRAMTYMIDVTPQSGIFLDFNLEKQS